LPQPRAAQPKSDETTGDLNILADMIIVGAGPSATTIDANGTVTHDRAFRVEGARIAILGVTIRGGQKTFDAAMEWTGGAVDVRGGALILSNCTVRDSEAGTGGGLHVQGGTVLVTDSALVGNTANSGGAIAKSGGAITIERTTIDGNSARFGGGVYDSGPLDSVMFVVDSTVANNRSHGQPLFAFEGSGGGFYLAGAGAVTFQNATITGNAAENNGGGIFNWTSGSGVLAPIRVFSSTITGNSAVQSKFGGRGGGLYVYNEGSPDRFSFQNTILAGNGCNGRIISNGYNLVPRFSACTIIGPVIAAEPETDLRIGPLQANGGPTPTRALLAADSAARLPQSPAIDQGDPQGCRDANGAVLTVDQRGVARPFGATDDIGAYQLNVCTYSVAQAEGFVGVAGAAGTLPLTVNDTRCAWTAASSASWIVSTAGASGSGSGTVGYTVLPNPGGVRSGVLTAGGQTLLVRQASHEGLRGDFDGDRKTEVAIYRPSNGMWFMLRSGTGSTEGAGYAWGAAQDVPVPGDYDGDGRIDLSVYNPTSSESEYYNCLILLSSSDYTRSEGWRVEHVFIPVPGDYDGDGRTDASEYDPDTGTWYGHGFPPNATGPTWGAPGDVPVPADYDGDGRTDVAVYRPSTGHWFILKSSTSFATWDTFQWGTRRGRATDQMRRHATGVGFWRANTIASRSRSATTLRSISSSIANNPA
jgi:hypothetical protein